MNITDLPNDIFLLIIECFSPLCLIRCRCVSKIFHRAFTDSDLNRFALQLHYPRVRELRLATNNYNIKWSEIFAKVAARYHHLKSGQPRRIEKFSIGKSFVVPQWARYYPFHYPDTLWTYDNGILIFPSAELKGYALYDLQAGNLREISLKSETSIVRRIRLKGKVLVVEWCELSPIPKENENETAYRHFASAYDLVGGEGGSGKWDVIFRNEWKIHSLGLPLGSKTRFFSCHSQSHYAIYLWRQSHNIGATNDPIESLAIWDISSPSQYRPSQDLASKLKPSDEIKGATMIKYLTSPDPDFYRIRQRTQPVLRCLELDENHVYFIEEDHRWLVGHEASTHHPRLHNVKSVGIPFNIGPRWEDSCGADGDVNRSYCRRATESRHPEFAPCWRHEEFPYLTITEAFDEKAGVKFSARHCFMLETLLINVKPKIHITGPEYEISLRDDLWPQLLGKGKICGDERWLIGENNSQEVIILHFDRYGLKEEQPDHWERKR